MLSLFLLLAAIAAILLVEPLILTTERKTLAAPEALSGLKIVFASDLHGGGPVSLSRIESLVKKINAEQPDVVLLGGDFADNESDAKNVFSRLSKLRAKSGVFAVRGNHDAPYDSARLMREAGITPCENAGYWVKYGDSRLRILGVDDYNTGTTDAVTALGDATEQDFTLLLCHNPLSLSEVAEQVGANAIDYALCGHTHGGQVTLLGLWSPLGDRAFPAYSSQWVDRSGITTLYSNGVGTTAPPIRFMAPPQYHVLTLG